MSFRVKILKFLFIVLCRKRVRKYVLRCWKLLKRLKIPFIKSSIFLGGGGVGILDFSKGLTHDFESKKFRIDLLSYK